MSEPAAAWPRTTGLRRSLPSLIFATHALPIPMTPSISTAFPAERILLGPGPSPVPQRVLRALGAPTLGHLDPQYGAIMDETCQFLRQVLQTSNPLTFPVSGTGMAGMECAAVNLLEPGDEVIVGVNGVFG